MKKISLILFLCFATQVFSQNVKALKESAVRDAKIACEATFNLDFKTLISYTHPNIIKAAGGEESLEEFLITSFDKMKAEEGFKFESAKTLFVSDVVKEQGEYRCYVQNYMVAIMENDRLLITSHMLGFYNESTKKWRFVEAEEMKKPLKVAQFFPGFKTSMKIPENKIEIKEIKE